MRSDDTDELMRVEVRGTNTRNKGAQLMLQAIAHRLAGIARLSVPPAHTDYDVRAAMGVWQTLYAPQLPRTSAFLGNRVPVRTRKSLGFRADDEIQAVLDASGFHYTDSFKARLPKREALAGRVWSRRDIPKVVLPQAFGPFENKAVARWSAEALNQAEHVYARDSVSLGHLRTLGLRAPHSRCPDITIPLKPAETALSLPPGSALLVPNAKVFTHGKFTEQQYFDLLRECASALRNLGLEPAVLIHETQDLAWGTAFARANNLAVFTHADPLVLKATLASSEMVIASRYHAVVSALSSGVPTLALGWSHKYVEVLKDFLVPSWNFDVSQSADQQVRGVVRDDEGRARCQVAKQDLSGEVDAMWTSAFEYLGLA